MVIFKLDPGAPIGNDLGHKELSAFEENSRRAMQLRNNDPLSAVDDECAVVSHQWNFTKEDFFFFNVANRFDVRVGVFVVNGKTDLDLQRHAVAHAALLAFLLIVFVFQAHRLAAIRTKLRPYGIEGAAHMAQCFAGTERIDLDIRAAALTSGAQVFQAFQIAALALPVTDLILDEIERSRLAKIGNRKH